MVRLAFLLIYAIATLVYSAINRPWRQRDRNRTLKWLARRLGGTHQPERRDRHAFVSWNVSGTTAVLYLLEKANGRVDGVTIRLGTWCRFRVRLLPETGWARVRRFFGAQDLQTGDGAFDRAFLVQADREANARRVLTREVRAAMAGLTRWGPMSLDLGPHGIVLRTPEGFVDQLDRLTAFAAEALELARALMQVLGPSVVMEELENTGPGICPVCSTPVEEDRGLCVRCHTPHHKDCWNYFGGCAIFACAGRPQRLRALPRRNRVLAA